MEVEGNLFPVIKEMGGHRMALGLEAPRALLGINNQCRRRQFRAGADALGCLWRPRFFSASPVTLSVVSAQADK